MPGKQRKLYPFAILLVVILSIVYIVTGIFTYQHLQRLDTLQIILNRAKSYDYLISAQANLLRNSVYHTKEEQQEWQENLMKYDSSMKNLFTETMATSPSEIIRRDILHLEELWQVSYEEIKRANSHLEYFDFISVGEALSSSIETGREKHSRDELYKLAQLNYELKTYDSFLKDVLSEKLDSLSHAIELHIYERKLRTSLQIIIAIPAISISIILLLLALMRAERQNHQRIEQMQEMQRLESLGRAAGRISHDFKNIISGIIGFTELAKMEDNCPQPLAELFEEIAGAAQRAVELSSSITSFTKDDPGNFENVDIEALLTEVNRLVKVSTPHRVECVVHIPHQQFTIRGNATQLYQVFINLAINASHAIENKGKIILSAKKEREGFVTLRVSDTGCGIMASQLPHIFNSGYTTNGKSGGSGFGLFIVKEIITHHSGRVSVESTPGVGSTFIIELPLI